MLGLPYEKLEDIFKTIAMNKLCNTDVQSLGTFYPYQGTPIRRMLKEKFATESMYFFAGGQFTITKELINYVYTLKSTEQDSFVLIDDTDTPILIEDISDFYNNITDKYYVALNNYHKDYSKLEKSRSVDGLVE